MKNYLLAFMILIGAIVSSQAQDYESAVGVRLGYPLSITYKKFVSENNAFEVYGGFRDYTESNALIVNGAYLIHTDIESVDNLRWYWGFGAGVALYTSDGAGTDLAISGYVGLEYTLEGTPVSFSIDWAPTILLGGGPVGTFGGATGGLAARYILD